MPSVLMSGLMLGLTPGLMLGLNLGPVHFARPVWLILIPVLGALVWWIGRRSLSGLGGATRWTALALRLFVIAALSAALAQPSSRRVSETVSVIAVVDASRSIPNYWQDRIDQYLREVAANHKREGDWFGGVTAARDAFVQLQPRESNDRFERTFVGQRDATDLASGLKMGVATADKAAANRILLVSDGNETAGSLLQAAETARALGIQVDVLMVDYEYATAGEVIIEDVQAPAAVRKGETITVRVMLRATRPVIGRLSLAESGQAIDLDPEGEGTSRVIQLGEGVTPYAVEIKPLRPGPQQFEAAFEPLAALGSDGEPLATELGDSIPENNRSGTTVFVGAEGAVLLVSETADEIAPLEQALLQSGINVQTIRASEFPATLAELTAYEAVILANEPAYNFSDAQQEITRQYVHDAGGGLVVIGGPDSFGAGGWIGSPLADALPIRLDPPQKRQMPRGALVLVIHSVEMPRGVFYGKEVSRAAVDNLSRLDLVGINEYSGIGGTDWVLPISPVGDRQQAYQAINKLTFGDMPSFNPSLQLTLDGLVKAEAGQKHAIVISDGDPSLNRGLLDDFRAAGITISTVGVFPHSAGDFSTLRTMAERTGGNFYPIQTQAALATLPSIFVKEAQTIRRSLIWEGEAFSPSVVAVGAEPMRGITGVPPITGYVVASDREGLSLVTMRGKEDDPVAAIWQHGLGKVVTFTSDATTRWGASWVGWGSYTQFWEQHVRWAMRPGGSATLRITTQNRGDDTHVVIEAFDPEGDRLDFASFQGRVATPDGEGSEVKIRQVGPGRYEGVFDSSDAGSYVMSVRYRAPGGDDEVLEGSAQAAVTRPFADEFRALTSNQAILQRVADMTGGRVLTGDALTDDPWRREGLTKPVDLRTIWLWVAVVGVGLFLLDVAVRRVRIDPRAIGAGIMRSFGASPQAKTASGESLQAVRERARQRMGGSAEEAASAKKAASRKYEADPSALSGSGAISVTDERPEDKPIVKPEKPKAGKDEPEDSISALMRAKRRAREEFGGDEKKEQ